MLATIAFEAFLDLDAPVRRLTTPDVPIPYNEGLMKAVLPSTERIEAAIEELLAFRVLPRACGKIENTEATDASWRAGVLA
ncbi:MAG: hypothetical protein ACE5M4_02175 [Anaerolineales bacterium]